MGAAGAPEGWKWDKGGTARADDSAPAECDQAVATCDEPADDAPAGDDPVADEPEAGGTEGWSWNGRPDGWSWNNMPDGWSWNEAEIVSLGLEVTLAAEGSSVAVALPDGVTPTVGDTVTVIDTGTATLLGFRTAAGDIEWTLLGWSWND